MPPSLITLEASIAGRRRLQSGSIEITVIVATSDGDGNSIDLEQLNQVVSAVDDTALATSFGKVMGVPVTVISQPPVIGTTEIEVPFLCPKGKWCTAGLVVDCPLGTYNPLENQDFATACLLCPPNSVTSEISSTSREQCVCIDGYYDANSSRAIDSELLRVSTDGGEPISMIAAVVNCLECPIGTDCGTASTLEELPLLTGFYRLDTTTVDVRECPDARKNCSTNFGTSECHSTSGCRGGAAKPCAQGLIGTYCQLCNRTDGALMSYSPASDDKVASCTPCGDVGTTIGLGFAALAFLILLVLVFYLIMRKLPACFVKHLTYFNSAFTPKNKLKVRAQRQRRSPRVATRTKPLRSLHAGR